MNGIMADPYVYEGTNVLKNKFDIRDVKALLKKEFEIVAFELYLLQFSPLEGNYDLDHLCKMHKQIFGGLYEWAGQVRNMNILKRESFLKNDSIEYEKWPNIKKSATKILDSMKTVPWKALVQEQLISEIVSHYAQLWKVHPFREGNTRTITNFIIQYMEEQEIFFSRLYFVESIPNLRKALSYASLYYDGLNKSILLKPLQHIIKTSMERHEQEMERYLSLNKDGKLSWTDYYNMIWLEKSNEISSQGNNKISKAITAKDEVRFEK